MMCAWLADEGAVRIHIGFVDRGYAIIPVKNHCTLLGGGP